MTEKTATETSASATIRWRKWDATPHWVHPVTILGEDQHGRWFGQMANTLSSRPGAEYVADTANVVLQPHVGNWVATFTPAAHPDHVRIYVDLGCDIRWDETTRVLSGIDMDLDVIKTDDDRPIWIDDVDEFAQHRVEMAYPDHIAEMVERAADEVRESVTAEVAPFDGRAEHWFAALAALTRGR